MRALLAQVACTKGREAGFAGDRGRKPFAGDHCSAGYFSVMLPYALGSRSTGRLSEHVP